MSSKARFIFILALIVTVLSSTQAMATLPAFFVFGDSLVDNGNNNYLATPARADSLPYGVDYPTHRPTGRFSNGLNVPDFISEQIGSEPTLPYLSSELRGEKLLIGANFASAGIGILDDTGIQFINIIRITKQLEYFQEYQETISNILGQDKAQMLVNQALVLITLGGNDFVNNYFLPFSFRSRQFTLPDYCRYLIVQYRKILMRLYELGGRRVLVTGTGPLGCVPAELAMRSRVDGECVPELQDAAKIYNPLLVEMIQGLNSELGANVFIAANAFSNMDFINNPEQFGFETSKVACCGQGPYNGLGQCTMFSKLCFDRSRYVFWDAYHPTERTNRLIVEQIMTGTTEYMNPMNLSTLMAMNSRI